MNEPTLKPQKAWCIVTSKGRLCTDSIESTRKGAWSRFCGDLSDLMQDEGYRCEQVLITPVKKKCGKSGVLNGEFKRPVSIMRRGDGQWVVWESAEEEPEDCEEAFEPIIVEAPTLPLAICLFSKALLGKDEQ